MANEKRLIDANALMKAHCEGCAADMQEMCKTDPVCASMMWVVDAPTVDAPHWATEQAYKNGYKKGYADALAYARRELNVIHECVTETLGMVKELKATASRAADINVGANLSPNEPPKGEE